MMTLTLITLNKTYCFFRKNKIGCCYHLVNDKSYDMAQTDLINWHPLYCNVTLFLTLFLGLNTIILMLSFLFKSLLRFSLISNLVFYQFHLIAWTIITILRYIMIGMESYNIVLFIHFIVKL
jgi:hypothetical protein